MGMETRPSRRDVPYSSRRNLKNPYRPASRRRHVYREEADGGQLRSHRPYRSPAHSKSGTAELSKDEQVVQDDIGDDQDDRRRDESSRPSQARQERAEGERCARQTEAVCFYLKVAVYGVAH